MTAQNQSKTTNLVKAMIDKSQGDSLCRVCRKVDESIGHVVSGCSKLSRKEYPNIIFKSRINCSFF